MRYSLVNRVRGIFLGALLGESLANGNSCDLGKIAVLGTESLISLGKLDVDDWLKRQQQAGIELETNINSWGQIIFATLPVVIFFHEDTAKMRENILAVQRILNWQNEPVVTDASLIIGYAIARSLNEKLNPIHLISETVSFLGNTSTSLPQELIKVNALLEKGAGLEIACRELSSIATQHQLEETFTSNISLAIYCFLSTLEDFPLTILRATQNHDLVNQDVISAITGSLSGAYNSSVGIPINWQIPVLANKSSKWGLHSFAQMLKLADTMMEVWSGVYDLNDDFSEFVEKGYTIFAAPHIIR
ncbi:MULTISPECIES: ADP-ribosylglycohydrolase family protein [unclassified Anabaena]|uniref:ADP-ribosylglycohydrolase family protein n=1 Tax=unclassified Anabaena TaxID=2619674 RepID=UPI0014462040|nr:MULTISPECIES: ADP-ribosylglycohydrolase family protein [unclassified Anabaena]MTJ06274.1 ADP-ribosylglycohydrolase family protein [Anabaena sp. UHCC 0204]MTJ54637.1 ADP-ribosylglycohydrolase family protein [Anabaena sp. UHCC 0253]